MATQVYDSSTDISSGYGRKNGSASSEDSEFVLEEDDEDTVAAYLHQMENITPAPGAFTPIECPWLDETKLDLDEYRKIRKLSVLPEMNEEIDQLDTDIKDSWVPRKPLIDSNIECTY